MPLLGFTTNKENIQTGKKVITVRKRAKDHRWENLQLGDPLYHYWKLRTPACEKLFPTPRPCTYKAGPLYPEAFTEPLARRDGFVSLNHMLAWFRKTHRKHLKQGTGDFWVIGWSHPDPSILYQFPILPNMVIQPGYDTFRGEVP